MQEIQIKTFINKYKKTSQKKYEERHYDECKNQ